MRVVRQALAMIVVAATRTSAQDTAAVATPDSLACEGRRVTSIALSARTRIAVDRVKPALLRPLVRALLRTTPTREEALRPYLLLRPGGMCTEARRRESERLLRNLRYVSNARIHAEADGDGVRLVVEATDDLRPVAGLRLDGAVPEYLQYGTTSLDGRGVLVAGEWNDGGSYRDGFGARVTDWSAFGRRTIASLNVARRPLGQLTLAGLGEPYITRFQKLAWEVSLRDETQYVPLQRNVDEPAAWRTEWRTLNAAMVGRVHARGAQLLAGGLFTHERIEPADSGVLIGRAGLKPPVVAGLGDRYGEQDGARAGAIVGVRALSFTRVTGLEALEGVSDMARGVQVAGVVGRGVSGGDARPFLAGEAYLGAGGPRSFANARVTFERRAVESGDATRLASARAAWYWQASPRQVQEVSLEFTGVWRDDMPSALFVDDRTGPRGYDGALASGSRLLVGRVERRVRAGGFGRAVGLGVAGFVDAAKLWAGDTPLATTTDPLVGAGASLLAAIPRDSRKTIRVDAAFPMTRLAGAGGVTVRVTITNAGRAYWREAAGFSRSRIAPTLRTLLGWF